MNQAVLSFVCLRGYAHTRVNMPPPCRNAHLPQGPKQPKSFRLSGLATHGSKTCFAKEGGAHTENPRKNQKTGLKKHVTLYSTPLSAVFWFSQNTRVSSNIARVAHFLALGTVFAFAILFFLSLSLSLIDKKREKEREKQAKKDARIRAKNTRIKNHVIKLLRGLHTHCAGNPRMSSEVKTFQIQRVSVLNVVMRGYARRNAPLPPLKALFFGGADRGQ